jgi:hypothetical protein
MPTNEWPQPVDVALEVGSPILRDGGRYGAFQQPPFRKALIITAHRTRAWFPWWI